MRLLLLFVYFYQAVALFPGRVPDEGDIRHLYPLASISIGLKDHAHILPYILGWLENIDYPKNRIHLELYPLGKEDSTRDQVQWWKSTVKDLFHSISIHQDIENWEETALRNARLKKSSRVLISTGNNLIRNEKIIQDLSKNKEDLVVLAFMGSAGESEPSNIAELPVGEDTRRKISTAHFPLLIQLDSIDSSYLTFHAENLPNYEGSPDPLDVFVEAAHRMEIAFHVDLGSYHGVYFNDDVDLPQQRRVLRYHLCDLVADDAALPSFSRTVRPWTLEPDLWGLDRIYLINLKRRPDRLKKMTKIFGILGIEFTILEAIDGKNLTKEYSIQPLPNYEDPIAKRPLKTGEIGCFLSHFRVWEEVKKEQLKRVIVFEDDLRFAMDGMERVKEVLQDFDVSHKEWDLIYLGRKKMAPDQDELWVPLHRHLSTVGYSYWTLGYMLSLEGAEKLLRAKPLEKLVPVDEYLPIMFNKHPNKEWMSHFAKRDLEAFTLYPLVVFPQKYTNEAGYISDTEDSFLLQSVPKKDEL